MPLNSGFDSLWFDADITLCDGGGLSKDESLPALIAKPRGRFLLGYIKKVKIITAFIDDSP